MLNLNDLRHFVLAVELGSFTAAGRRLGCPKSTVSKRVAELESAIGTRLLHRSSRSLSLTDAGQAFFEHARAALVEAETAEDAVRRRQAEPSGTVRISTSVPTAQLELARFLPSLARALPRVTLQLDVTDRHVDLVHEGVDIAIRSHFAPLPDSGLVQRVLQVDPIVLVASPAYLRAHGTPREPADLAAHDGLHATLPPAPWRLHHPRHGMTAASPALRFAANESSLLLAAARKGLGIVGLPLPMVDDDLAARRLRRVLPEWQAGEVTTTMLTPHRRDALPSVRAVAEAIVAELGRR